jgi:hypothetical protein
VREGAAAAGHAGGGHERDELSGLSFLRKRSAAR